MKGQLKVSTPAEYMAKLEGPRRTGIAALDALISRTVTKLEPFIHSGMLAYGPWHEGDWFRIGVASNKNAILLYICAGDDEGYVAERYKEALPKANVGRSCVRFKRLDDLDQGAFKRLIREGARSAAKA